jgi:hypothetical protein
MNGTPNRRFRSGEPCPDSGWYIFDGYLDGSPEPLPPLGEMEVSLEAGETFPSIHSPAKDCYWQSALEEREAEPAGAAAASAPVPESLTLFSAREVL